MDLKRKRKILLTQLKQQYDLWQKEEAIRVKRNQEILNHMAKTEEHLENLLQDLESLKKFSSLGSRASNLLDGGPSWRSSLAQFDPIENDLLAEAQKRLEAIIENNLGSLSDDLITPLVYSNSEDGLDIDLLDSSFNEVNDHELLNLHAGFDRSSYHSKPEQGNKGSKEQPRSGFSPLNIEHIAQTSYLKTDKLDAYASGSNDKVAAIARKVDEIPALLNEELQDNVVTQSVSNKTTLNSDVPSIEKEVIQMDINKESEMVEPSPRRVTLHLEKSNCPNLDQLLEECGTDPDDSSDPAPAVSTPPGQDVKSFGKQSASGVQSEIVRRNESLPTGDEEVLKEDLVTELFKRTDENPNKGQVTTKLTSGKVLQMFGKLSSLDSDSSSDKDNLSDDFFD